jgi:hypothetical protein
MLGILNKLDQGSQTLVPRAICGPPGVFCVARIIKITQIIAKTTFF